MRIDRHKISTMLAEQAITQAVLADNCGVSRQTVSTVLTRGTCSAITAGKLAKGLGCNVNEITKEDE